MATFSPPDPGAPRRALPLQSRRELGDRSVPLGYVAGRRATENAAGGHFQHPAKGVAWKA